MLTFDYYQFLYMWRLQMEFLFNGENLSLCITLRPFQFKGRGLPSGIQ